MFRLRIESLSCCIFHFDCKRKCRFRLQIESWGLHINNGIGVLTWRSGHRLLFVRGQHTIHIDNNVIKNTKT